MFSTPTTQRSTVLSLAILVGVLLIGGAGGAVAHGMIGTNQIKNNAVTTPKIKNDAVTSPKIKNGHVKPSDLAPAARGAKVFRYPVPGNHNFATTTFFCVRVPVTEQQARTSQWSAGMESGGIYFTIGNWGIGPSSEYRFSIEPATGRACILKASGPGETYTNISIYRTVPSTVAAETVIVPRVRPRG